MTWARKAATSSSAGAAAPEVSADDGGRSCRGVTGACTLGAVPEIARSVPPAPFEVQDDAACDRGLSSSGAPRRRSRHSASARARGPRLNVVALLAS
eukprot:CAMPEP_0179287882 /NCGR_PEP_ID=MMETSP0797-20121207/40496_1 /TAXON_ID=47934 /ORGANISM="Dinophysis acuminata, Strain DAEP01" /LENGTH=96 /DNA_ID=CAMNT_0020996831 /DNA_START=207 /DNA_END=497 /DNA_ORIENTATION=+